MTGVDAAGQHLTIQSAGTRVEIGTVAAVLRSLTVDGIQLTEPLVGDVAPPYGSGIILAPWPNRVRDGKWTLDGVELQLEISEPKTGNALHGLLRWADYQVREQTADSVLLGALIPPQQGWPFLLDTWVRYEARADGVTVTHGIRNLGTSRAPYALGAHPYLRIGAYLVDDLVLTLAASTYFPVDERMNPTGEVPVDGTTYDLRAGRKVQDVDVDTAFGGVTHRDGAGAWLTAPDGSSLELVQDVDWGFLQVFTPRDFPRPEGPGLAVTIEPMTAPPDALNTGQGLRWLEPGESSEGSWGLRYSASGQAGTSGS